MKAPGKLVLAIVAAALGWLVAGQLATPRQGSFDVERTTNLRSAIVLPDPPAPISSQLATLMQTLADLQNGDAQIAASLAFIDALESYELRGVAYWVVAMSAIESGPQAFMPQLLAVRPGRYPEFTRAFLAQWYQLDPAAAWQAMQTLPRAGSHFDNAVPLSVIATQFRLDPDSVYEFVTENFWPSDRGEIWAHIAGDLAVDIPTAIAALKHMHGDRGEAISVIAKRWAQTDPQAATRWAVRVGEEEAYNPSLAAFTEWMKTDPDAALAAEDSYDIATFSGSLPFYKQIVNLWLIGDDHKNALRWTLANQDRTDEHLPYGWGFFYDNWENSVSVAAAMSPEAA